MATERPVGRGRMDVAATFAVLAVCGAALAAVAWTRPTTAAANRVYTQVGSLAYSAPASPSSVYGSAGVTTGEPVYASVISTLTVKYTYQFQSDPPAVASGVEQLVATVSSAAGLSRTLPLQQPTAFSGDHFTATAPLQLAAIDGLAKAFDKAAGSRSTGSYQVVISPSVRVVGSLDSAPLQATFNPATSFNYGSGQLTPGSASGGALGTPTQQFASTLTGAVMVPNGQPAALALGVSVQTARLVGLAVLFGSLVVCAAAGIPYWRRATSADEVARITSRHGASIVEVDAIEGHAGVVVVDLKTFEGVLQVSRRLECPILHWADGADVYAVVDGTTLYQYRPELVASLPLRPVDTTGGRARRAANRDG